MRWKRNDWEFYWNLPSDVENLPGELVLATFPPRTEPISKHTGDTFTRSWGCSGMYEPDNNNGINNLEGVERLALIYQELVIMACKGVPREDIKKVMEDLDRWESGNSIF